MTTTEQESAERDEPDEPLAYHALESCPIQ